MVGSWSMQLWIRPHSWIPFQFPATSKSDILETFKSHIFVSHMYMPTYQF